MTAPPPPLPADGYHVLPPGKLANAVTWLEMRAPPATPPRPLQADHAVVPIDPAAPDAYRALYRAVGEPWLWASQFRLADPDLAALFTHPLYVAAALRDPAGQALGLVELDLRMAGACEIVYFGLVPGATGRGLGPALLGWAVARAWAHPGLCRLWLHTCSFDSPAALPTYLRAGFLAFASGFEIMDDPRLMGTLPRTAAPHVPLIAP